MEPSACLRILHLVASYFKEERVLVAHPSSCHPWRVFGYLENERKGEKVGETGKEAGALKASRQKEILLMGEIDLQCLSGGFL